MNWRNSLFGWATSLPESISDATDRSQYFANYFENGDVCGRVLLYTIIIAAVAALLFYGLCRFSFAIAKRRYWFITALIALFATIAINESSVSGKYNDNAEKCTGFYLSIGNTEASMVESYLEDEELALEQRNVAQLLRDDLTSGDESLPLQIALTSGLYLLIFFFVFSLIIKRWSINGTAIPF